MGKGICGNLDNDEVVLGNEQMLRDRGMNVPKVRADGTVVYVLKNGVYQGYLRIEDEIKKKIVKSAISTLSASELQAIKAVFEALDGTEGILVASRIADNTGITRSVIVNALKKFDSAGVISTKSSGMKGTKILNEIVFDEIKKLDD